MHYSYINEYKAGYIQGKLQGEQMIRASRDNTWKNLYLCDTNHTFPKDIPPSKADMDKAGQILKENYASLDKWIADSENTKVAQAMLKLQARMLGIFEGAMNHPAPESYDDGFNGEEYLEILKKRFQNLWEKPLGYGNDSLSLVDVYFINAQMDLADVISNSRESRYGTFKSDHCSAFLKRTENDIFWTHNSWCGYLTQSMTISYCIYNYDSRIKEDERLEFVTQNCYCAGQFGRNMDFGFNKYGICFNETTHRRASSA